MNILLSEENGFLVVLLCPDARIERFYSIGLSDKYVKLSEAALRIKRMGNNSNIVIEESRLIPMSFLPLS